MLISLGLRLWWINSLPALNADEAAIGYNAYSLLKTGKDEFGTPWPFVFQSFNDYKPGIYFYIVLPFVWMMGLNIWAVRLPAILISVMAVAAMYFVTRKVVGKSFPGREAVALCSALALAIMPWHIHFSRGGWETQVSTAFLLFGTWCLMKGLRKPGWLLVGVLWYALALYTYHSMRVVVPLMGISFVALNWQKLWGRRQWLIASGIVALVTMIPLAIQLMSPVGLSRASGVSIWADSGPLWRVNEIRGYHDNFETMPVKLLHNKVVGYGLRFFENYLAHFSGNFLFIEGDVIQRNRVPYFGQMYLLWAAFLFIGIEALVKYPILYQKLMIAWLFIAPIPAALTFQSPHAVRAFSMTIPLSFFVALGAVRLWRLLSQRFTKPVFKLSLIILALSVTAWGTTRYILNYYLLMVPHYPYSSQYGFEELVPWVESVKGNYQKVWVTDAYDQPYVMFLFHSRYPPERFQLEAKLSERDQYGFSTVRDFNGYHFEKVDAKIIAEKTKERPVLVIGTDEEIPDDWNIINTIRLIDGKIIFQVAELR